MAKQRNKRVFYRWPQRIVGVAFLMRTLFIVVDIGRMKESIPNKKMIQIT